MGWMAPLRHLSAKLLSDRISSEWEPSMGEVTTMAQSAKIEAGQVHLPREAEWLDTFLHELLAFPNGRYDDQVDSVSQFLKWTSLRGPFDLMMIGMAGKVFVGGIQVN
jgi:phage terminase large subunit-like protein